MGLKEIAKWWSGLRGPGPRRFIYLRTGVIWRVEAVQGDGKIWRRDFFREEAAMDCIEAMMKRAGGDWTEHRPAQPR